MERYEDDFPKKLKGFEFKTLEKSNYCIYGLSNNLDLIYVNPSFIKLAKKNGFIGDILTKYPLGSSIINAFSGQKIKEYYYQNYIKVLATGEIWSNEYECSNIDEFRYFHQRVYPLKNKEGLLVINSLMVKLPMKLIHRKANKAIMNRYLQPNGFITQCSNCRYIQRNNISGNWEWIPEWVINMPSNISHSICPLCYDYFWK